MIYHHPLAYLLGIEGLALLRAWHGEHDRAFVDARLAEVRRLLDEPALAAHPGVDVRRGTPGEGYAAWAPTYDDPSNGLFPLDAPVIFAIVDRLPAGDALDAACGTGRFAAGLVERGHRVVGVDSSPEMLDVARAKVPDATFRLGDLAALPVGDASCDLVVSSLAMTHAPDLGPVFAELARVLRPGGHAVIADIHHEAVFLGSLVKAMGADGEPGIVPAHRHQPGSYVRAALAAGFDVRGCEERRRLDDDTRNHVPPAPADIAVGPWEDWPWSLLALAPAAAQSAWNVPAVIVWTFERRSGAEGGRPGKNVIED